jgi:ppGpp synthetase/RelA/SpoT-type nucleotidyltranferase
VPPFTKSQIDRLGERLRKEEPPGSEALAQLEQLRGSYGPPMAEAQALIREHLGLDAASRLKTVNTIVEKLRREKTRLSTMQDIAGVRIVLAKGLADQQERVAQIESLFPGARVQDRRENPNRGYRAMHVIVRVGGFPVEVQVRTALQHSWAEAMEKLADDLGRGIRYGSVPTEGELEFHKMLVTSEFVRVLEVAAGRIANADPADHPALIEEVDSQLQGLGPIVKLVLDSYEQ